MPSKNFDKISEVDYETKSDQILQRAQQIINNLHAISERSTKISTKLHGAQPMETQSGKEKDMKDSGGFISEIGNKFAEMEKIIAWINSSLSEIETF